MRECRYRVELCSVRQDNRWLSVSVTKKERRDELKALLLVGSSDVPHDWIGYSGSEAAYGKMIGTYANYRQLEALNTGSVFMLELSVSKKLLRIYTEDRKIDLVSNQITDDSYYITHGFYNPETSIYVERLA